VREIACARHGIVTWAEARAAGFSARAIDIRLERGTWRRLGRVLIIPRHVTSPDAGLAWALHLHAGPESIVSGSVAARLQSWDIAGTESVVISKVPVRFPENWRATVLRRGAAAQVEHPQLPPLAPAADALADLLIIRPEAQARHLLDHALQRRWISPEALDEVIAQRSGRGRKGLARLRMLRERAVAGSRSEAEQRMAALLKRTGGTWIANYAVRGRRTSLPLGSTILRTGSRATEHAGSPWLGDPAVYVGAPDQRSRGRDRRGGHRTEGAQRSLSTRNTESPGNFERIRPKNSAIRSKFPRRRES
jgi:hypothetical protein